LYEEYRQRRLRGDDVCREDYARRYGIPTGAWSTDDTVESGHDATLGAGDSAPGGISLRSLESALDALEKITTFPAPGEAFAGFDLIRVLGEGAFARVFLARQRELANREVVLKITTRPSCEADRLARLQQTNIVPIHSAHHDAGLYTVCMPFLGTVTLADVLADLRQHGPIRGVLTPRILLL
jgi:serine/threonine protein kinase